jgi:transposase
MWTQILSFLKTRKGLHTKNERKLRTFVEGVWYTLRTGCQWRLIPATYGHWRSLHRRYKSWSDRGIWEALMGYVSEVDTQDLMLDSTIARAHACASGYEKSGHVAQALGRSKGGFTTKIHALVDALGNPIKFTLTPGQQHDITQVGILLENICNSNILADKAYYSTKLIEVIESKGCTVVIPAKRNSKNPRAIDKHIYKERHLIENFFSKIKHFRRVFSRFDKTISSYLGFINFAGALIWMR